MDILKLKELLTCNYFELFGFKPSFNLNLTKLKHCYRNLQKQVHPDNFANATLASQALALQASTYINNAYSALLSPLTRALALLELQGIHLDLAQNNTLPAQFLMLQMELHEEIELAQQNKDQMALEKIEQRLHQEELQLIKQIEIEFNHNQLKEVIELIKQLAFYHRLNNVLTNALNHLWE